MIRKLRIKFIAIIMVIVSVMLSIIFGILYTAVQRDLENQTINMLRMIVSNPRKWEQTKEIDGEFALPFFVLQLNSKGEVSAASGGFYDLPDEDFLSDVLQYVEMSSGETGYISEYRLRYCQRHSPFGKTVAFCDTGNEQIILRGMLHASMVIGGASFLVFLVISIFFSKWAIQPVEKAWMEQKQFVADASHELKTPLTVIMTNAELLQNPDFDADSREQFLDSILIMTKQMRGLVEKMLELARADYQAQPMGLSELNFSRLAEETYLSFEGVFFEKGLILTADLASDISVRGNQATLRQVLEILLDNAQKYSAPGGETKLTLATVHGKCKLTVSSPGETISHKDLKNIFRRFYRLDNARSRDGSFGLGLPIAQQIVMQHHGKIWAESSRNVNTFTVELPTVSH